MATITKRSPGRWQAKIRKRGYKTQSRTFSTKARAERWATIVESEMERSVFADSSSSSRTLFVHVAERYGNEVLSNQKSVQEAPFRLDRLMSEFGGNALSAITPAMISAYRDKRLAEVSGDLPADFRTD